MIRLIIKLRDKDAGSPGEVAEQVQQAIESIESAGDGFRFEVESCESMEVIS